MTSLTAKVVALMKKHGVYINYATDKNSLNNLISKLKPIDCGVDLIRIGGNNDGGYLVPDDLEGIRYCFSPGVDVIANFEKECLERGITSFLADYSVDHPPIDLKGSKFIKKFVGAYNNEQMISFENWYAQSLPKDFDEDLILQMDIEGAEYETLLAMPVSILKKFRIIVLEVHNFQKLDNREYFKLINATFEKLAEHFESVHLHPNNCCGLANVNGVLVPPIFEVTYLRKDRVKKSSKRVTLPHPLDQPNFANKKEISFPHNWLN